MHTSVHTAEHESLEHWRCQCSVCQIIYYTLFRFIYTIKDEAAADSERAMAMATFSLLYPGLVRATFTREPLPAGRARKTTRWFPSASCRVDSRVERRYGVVNNSARLPRNETPPSVRRPSAWVRSLRQRLAMLGARSEVCTTSSPLSSSS